MISELSLECQLELLAAPATTPSGRFLTHPLVPRQAKIRIARLPQYRSLKSSITHLAAVVREGLWMQRTWRQYESIWGRLNAYARQGNLPLSDQSGTMLVNDLTVAPTTKVGYANQLANLFKKMGLPSDTLRTYAQAQRAQGSARPTHQAPPIPKTVLVSIAEQQTERLKIGLLLAWKTAFRWDDIARMTKRTICSTADDDVILDFGCATKTSRTRPFRPELLVTITGDFTADIATYLRQVLRRKATGKDTPLSPLRDTPDPRGSPAGRVPCPQHQAWGADARHGTHGGDQHPTALGGGPRQACI
ncbi:hypothetical protein NESM_000123600 [Novymonas esmeraldas]|uniref:Integrase n=1 Tax=Novymonas esmeraldas TaxID=1808958 RepID=A0AAW0F4B2_9TRYP